MTDNQKNHYSALFSDIFLNLQEDITLNQKKKRKFQILNGCEISWTRCFYLRSCDLAEGVDEKGHQPPGARGTLFPVELVWDPSLQSKTSALPSPLNYGLQTQLWEQKQIQIHQIHFTYPYHKTAAHCSTFKYKKACIICKL